MNHNNHTSFTERQGDKCTYSYDVIAYPDTIEYALYWQLDAWRLRWLRQLHPNMKIKPPNSERANYAYRLTLQQPCKDALLMLAEVREDQISTLRCDIAYDFPPEAAWLERHIRQKWRGNRKLYRIYGKSYFGWETTNRNVVPYSDKPSKITNKRCFHLELRFRGRR